MRSLLAILLFATTAAAQQPVTVSVRIVTEVGEITAELYSRRAPVSVANFLRYVDAGHYSGGSFYRAVREDNQPDSPVRIGVIQGDVHPWYTNDPFDAILLERTDRTGVRHLDGTLSMARDGPDTATSSFFICVGDQPELDFGGKRNPDGQGFAAFGKVTDGMEVVRRIQAMRAVGQAIMPPVRILEITRVR